MTIIGVLALQGAVREHIRAIESVGAKAIAVKHKEDLEHLDGVVLPGGESTTMRKLINRYDMMPALRLFAASGKPMFGTCAGLILLAKKLVDYKEPHIGVMDVEVERNSFGRQVDSFEVLLDLKDIGTDFPAVFIRAPHIVNIGEGVEVLGKYDGRIVLARDGQFLGCSFHPELTEDTRIIEYFVNMVKESKSTVLA
ncbi:pyridoxal 5'-phosphate synthase glutaminase subunit PdxT [Rummeliibacillus pycnus]|uniref:pyridoxal 5'-phosphate synthase glutaminase subunit PdxT n=1 Tax=Rummeliibacillus pycnus TaxID=101070 RepID=UPI000C9ADCFB|nr:pyridoxal 5'-phosphate synthase glutaminase subunit PdxT [Rummeliibacillus pycnus]